MVVIAEAFLAEIPQQFHAALGQDGMIRSDEEFLTGLRRVATDLRVRVILQLIRS